MGAGCPKGKLLTPGMISLGVCFISPSAPLPPVLGHADTFPHQWGSGCGPALCWAAPWPCQGWLWAFCWSSALCWGHRNREILLPEPDEEPGTQVRAGCSSLFKGSFCCLSPCKSSLRLSTAWHMVAVLERTKPSIHTGPEPLGHVRLWWGEAVFWGCRAVILGVLGMPPHYSPLRASVGCAACLGAGGGWFSLCVGQGKPEHMAFLG